MSIAPNVASVVKPHVTLEVECIDRRYLNAYIPTLLSEGGVVGYFQTYRQPFVSFRPHGPHEPGVRPRDSAVDRPAEQEERPCGST